MMRELVSDMANNNRQQQATKATRQNPWQSAMAQLIAQQAMMGNDNFLWGSILGNLLKNGWASQKRAYEETQERGLDTPRGNLYAPIRNWIDGIIGARKPRPTDNTEFYKTHDQNFGATSMLDYGTKDLYQSDRANAMTPYTWDDARIANEVRNAMVPDSYNNDLTHQLAMETISPTPNPNYDFTTPDITAPKYKNKNPIDEILEKYSRW